MVEKVTVEVTEEDLRVGVDRVGQATGDPIHRAAQRVFPEDTVMVAPAVLLVRRAGQVDRFFSLPEVAQEFLRRYDAAEWEHLDPISFEIEEIEFEFCASPTVVRKNSGMRSLLPRPRESR
jgi:hypothetical protein